jgi:oxalate decarboxylase/phosphoglucose isomerase-like protein (cupin superfamily)
VAGLSLVSGEETGGAMSTIETLSPPGSGPTYLVTAASTKRSTLFPAPQKFGLKIRFFQCEAGEHVFGPRNVFHTYRNVGQDPLKLVIVYSPGGFEQSFLDAKR